MTTDKSRFARYKEACDLTYFNKHKEASAIYAALADESEGYESAYYHYDNGVSLLSQGLLKEGFKEFEYRLDTYDYSQFKWPHTRWLGEDLTNKSLVIIQEQGFGDTIQYVRYVPIIKEKFDCKIYFVARKPLIRLLKSIESIDEVVELGDQIIDQIDYAVLDCSLPHLVGGIPYNFPYLKAGPWDKPLPAKPRVGLCWNGSSVLTWAVKKNVDKGLLSKFYDLPINFISIQYGDNKDIDDFYDAASLINELDLVISVDTANLHLSGALNKPVWLLSRFDACWRWADGNVWYPTIRKFTQLTHENWADVVDKVYEQLVETYTNF